MPQAEGPKATIDAIVEGPLGPVFAEPALPGIDQLQGVRPTEDGSNAGWDRMSRRGARANDSRDAEKLRTLRDTKPIQILNVEQKSDEGFLERAVAGMTSIGFFGWATLVLSAVLLSILINQCALAMTYKDGMHNGLNALNDNNLALAKREFDASIIASPSSSDPYYYRALCGLQENANPDVILQDLDKAIFLNPKNLNALTARAAHLLRMHRYDGVVKDCTTIIALDPSRLEAYRLRANAYNHQLLFSKAIADLSKFVVQYQMHDNTYADALSKRAFAYDQEHKYHAAIQDYTAAIKCDPKNSDYFVSRAIVYKHERNWKKAIADCNRAIALNPSSPAIYKVRGYSREMLHSPAYALSDLDKLVKLLPTVDTHRLRGYKRLAARDYLGSLEDFDYVLQEEPADTKTAARYEKAKKVLQASVSRKTLSVPDLPTRRNSLAPIDLSRKSQQDLLREGYALLMDGKTERAVQYIAAAVKANPNDPRARRLMAHALVQSRSPKNAITQFAAQSALESMLPADRLAYANALAQCKDTDQALDIYTDILNDNPKDDRARFAALKILLQKGATAEANKLATEGIQQSPSQNSKYTAILRTMSAKPKAQI